MMNRLIRPLAILAVSVALPAAAQTASQLPPAAIVEVGQNFF